RFAKCAGATWACQPFHNANLHARNRRAAKESLRGRASASVIRSPALGGRRRCTTLWLRFGNLKQQLPIDCRYLDFVAWFDAAAKQFFRERVFEKTLHRTAHWPGSILRIVSFLDEEFLRAWLQLNVDFLGFDAREHFVHFQINNAQQLRLAERMKHDDLVQP